MSGRGFVDCPNKISSLTGLPACRSVPLMEVVPPPKKVSETCLRRVEKRFPRPVSVGEEKGFLRPVSIGQEKRFLRLVSEG